VPTAGEPGGLPAGVVFGERWSVNPSKLAKIAGRSVQTVSGHLAKLRAADLVRYDTDGKQVRYWLKHKRDTSKLLKALETIVHSSSKLT
jgi:hypothetical protein